MKPDELKIAEHFYSIQGEGTFSGRPAVFLRLSLCNFNCVWCDTVDVWTKGTTFSFPEVDAIFDREGYYFELRKGAHLVLTGGDPLIQQEQFVSFLDLIGSYGRAVNRFFIEVETQGYLEPIQRLESYVRHWNVSPKLENSGISKEKRYKPDLLRWFANRQASFKFPISTMIELKEVEHIVRECGIRRSRVFLMPVCDSRDSFIEVSSKVASWCMKSGFSFSPRLQLVIWDKAVGV